MPLQEFGLRPDYSAKVKKKPLSRSVKFGDGYEQRTPLGINNVQEIWTVSFTLNQDDYIFADNFLVSLNGVTPFYWYNAYGQLKTYVCKEWDGERMFGKIMRLNCVFEQVFDTPPP